MSIPILSTFVGYLAEGMRLLLTFCYNITATLGFPNYGIAIIVLTLIIKLALLPLALKQIRSTKRMQHIQPKIQEIQKKYKNDKKRLQQEMEKIYNENGVNPLSGCLPILIQMPFLVSIFYALQGYPYDPAHQSFLWLESLASADPTYVLPILSALSTYVISKQTMPSNAPGNQKAMLIGMPIFIGYISLSFPSGLVIYWVICNVFQFVQQFVMFRNEKEESPVLTGQNVKKAKNVKEESNDDSSYEEKPQMTRAQRKAAKRAERAAEKRENAQKAMSVKEEQSKIADRENEKDKKEEKSENVTETHENLFIKEKMPSAADEEVVQHE